MMSKSQQTEYSTEWTLAQLRQRVDALPLRWRGDFEPVCRWLVDWSQSQKRLVHVAQEAVDQLRLDITYLKFDLEATRRERDSLRIQLENDAV
jgi:hypothetical protein